MREQADTPTIGSPDHRPACILPFRDAVTRAACLGFGLAVGGCSEPRVLAAPAREPQMRVVDHDGIPLPGIAVPTGGAAFDRLSDDAPGRPAVP